MPSNDFEAGRTVPLLIPEPIWREWKINSVGADSLKELQAEHGSAVGYEFDWGQIIEEVFDADPATDSQAPADAAGLEVRWNFVLGDVHSAFLHAGGNLGELSDLAIALLAKVEGLRHDLPEATRENVLPACISFDEGNNISAFAVCVVGRSNVSRAREWMANYFIPAMLPMLVDRLHAENAWAVTPNAARA